MLGIINPFTIKIDTVKGISHNIRNLYAGDNKVYSLHISLYQDTIAINLNNTTAKIFFNKPNGTQVFSDLNIISAENGKVYLELSSQVYASVGDVKAEIVLYGINNEKRTMPFFTFRVLDPVHNEEAVESSNEFSSLTNAISQVQNIDNRFSTIDGQLADIVKRVEEFRINGETDETNMLQRAFNYVKEQVLLNKRVELMFKNGSVYTISAPLDLTYHFGCTLKGTSVIRVADTISTPLTHMIDVKETSINLYRTGKLTIQGLTFNANNRATKIIDAWGDNGFGLIYATIERCFFEGIMNNGYAIYGASWATTIENNYFIGFGSSSLNVGEWSGTGVYVGNSSNELVITKNSFSRLTHAVLRDTGNYGKTVITWNVFDKIRKSAIKLEGAENVTIEDNYFEGVGNESDSVYVLSNTEITGIKACIIVTGSKSTWDQMPVNCSIKRNEFSQCQATDLIVFDRGYGLEIEQNIISHKDTPHNSLVKILKYGFGYYCRNGNYGVIIKNNKLIKFDTNNPTGLSLVNRILDMTSITGSNTIDFFTGVTLSKVVINDVSQIDSINRKRKLPVSLYNRNFITDSSYTDFFTITKEIISGEEVYSFLRTSTSTKLNYIEIDSRYFERLKGTYVRFSFETANTQNGAGIRFTVSDGVKNALYLPNGNQTDKTKINEYIPMDFIFYIDPLATTLKFRIDSYCSATQSIYIKNFSIIPSGYDLSSYVEMI